MSHLALSFLGSISVTLDQEPITHFRSDKVLALLIYLSVEAHHPHSREALAGLLWPDYAESAARHNLSQTLLRLRQTIKDQAADPSFLKITRQSVQFNQGSDFSLDTSDLLAPINQGLLTSADQLTPDNLQILRQAARVYRGDFLIQFSLPDSDLFEEWALTKREYLRKQALAVLNRLIGHYEAQAEYEAAQHYAWQRIELNPLDEEAHQGVMRLLALSGQRSAALAQFETCTNLLAEELGAEPTPETVALYEQIQSGALGKTEGTRNPTAALPVPPTPQPDSVRTLSRLEPVGEQRLFGIDETRRQLLDVIEAQDRPWIIALDGIGGIGKTSLANDLARRQVEGERFYDIAWASAKQEEFRPESGLESTGRPALDTDTLTDILLEQLSELPNLTTSSQEKQLTLTRLLKAQPYLVIIDNLESVADYEALLPYLRQLANPTKFLLTTRHSLKAYADIYALSLSELPQTDVLAFIRYEAETRGITVLIQAPDEALLPIYQVVGGNPLALKLVLGQIGFLPLSQALENLKEAQGAKVEALYTYIYWQAWHMLNESSRQLFLTMPIIPNGTFTQLTTASDLDTDQAQTALVQLIALSLVEVGGDLLEPRYRLHRLTETFLMNEVLKWQQAV